MGNLCDVETVQYLNCSGGYTNLKGDKIVWNILYTHIHKYEYK